jgi:pyruvate-ferredoxin/flavodoxin oxidoreductase
MKVGQRAKAVAKPAPSLPVMLKSLPEGDGGLSDIHRFWEQTGSFYMKGQGSDNLVDPFMGLSVIPAVTGVYRDMTGVRFEHPEWNAENCTACGECFTQCPDSAIPGLVSTTTDVLNTAIQKIEIGGRPTRFLRKFSRAPSTRSCAMHWIRTGWMCARCWPMPSPKPSPKTRPRATTAAVWKRN